jgi:diguanylate cyclase (GGDEF)-like protein
MKSPWTTLFVSQAMAPREGLPGADKEAVVERARLDALTGLPNRRTIRQHIRSRLQDGFPEGRTLAALHIDLDGFARIDADLGGADADRVIQVVAQRIGECLLPRDTLARLDGDEFLVVLDAPVGDGKCLSLLSTTIRAAIARSIVVAGHDVFVTACIGIAHATSGLTKAEPLLRDAAAAVRRAKSVGIGASAISNAADATAEAGALSLGNALRSAVARKELRLAYQPQIDLRSGQVIGMEALVRWQHPTFGLLGPTRFLPAAEALGLIDEIGGWVINAACAQARAWQEAGVTPVRLTVNVAAQQLSSPDFATRLATVLALHRCDPGLFGIEITERGVIDNLDEVAAQLRRVRATGVEIALDDFGTGSSSLTCLRKLPIDIVKIDRSLMQTITSNAQTLSIVRAIIAMAHALGMKTMAEGVESPGQLEVLEANRCDRFQGHLFSAAVDAESVTRILQHGTRVPMIGRLHDQRTTTILILADEPWVTAMLKEQIGWRFGTGVRVEACGSGPKALARLRNGVVDIVIADLHLPEREGHDFLGEARALQPDLLCLMLVESADVASIIDDPRQGQVFRYLSKPWNLDLLLKHVGAALEHAAQVRSSRLGAEALALTRISDDGDASRITLVPVPHRLIEIVDRGHQGEVLMPQTLPTMPGDLWQSPHQ